MEGSDFEVITEDSLNEKTLHLDVSAGLKLSVLGGLVTADGSGKFLYDRTTSKSQARVSLRYKSTSKFEQLDMNHLGDDKVEYPRVFEDDIATHVVTGVQYGADAVFVFDRQVNTTEKFHEVHGAMKAMIKVLPSIDLQAGGSADLEIQNKDKVEKEKIQCKFFGDLILPQNPTTYQDAVKVYQELPKLLSGNSVPKKVWLYPLSKLDSRVQRMVREISSYLIDDLQEVMESLHVIEVQINDLIRNEVCVYFVDIKGNLEKLKRLIDGFKVTMMKNLSTLLPKVRGGGEEEVKLAELLEMNRKSPFSCEKVSSWIKEKEREVSTLAVYLKELEKHSIQFAFQPDEMITLTSGFTGEHVLCFDFNIPVGKDDYLQRMKDYLHGQSVEQELQQQKWYRSPELRQQFQRFVNFVKINSNRKEKKCKYVVTNDFGSTETNKVGIISVFVDACQTKFEPPDQPGVPCAANVTHNSVQLSWDKPKYGSKNVQFYTVSYRSVDSPPDQWTSSKECLVLTKLTPGSLYHFKVTAESAAGSGPASEVSEVRLPPDRPGKPWAIAITHNSVRLKWTKPEYGASIVNSYSIYYRSVDDLTDQWDKQTSNSECVLLTKLTPGTQYYFKVAAQSSVGNGPASEVGEVSLPPDQPGKPRAAEITQNSLRLEWAKPKHGAHTVSTYSIYYRSVDDPTDQWVRQTSSDECVVLTELTSGSLYRIKVTAESAAGSSPDSEVSEARLPPDRPGKPWATNVTHNTIQLQWPTKPDNEVKSVTSYTVLYRCYQFDPWSSHTTTDSQESALLTNLVPKRSYQVKVQAVSSAGTSSESELSDIIETLLPPPGKPYATNVTHNGLHLFWKKPEYGANCVQCYTVFYRSVGDPQENWCTVRTKSASERFVFDNLTTNMSYQFKVRAETTTGFSAESDPIVIGLPAFAKPKPKPWGAMLLSSCEVISTGNPNIYQLPLNYTMKKKDIVKADVGKFSFACSNMTRTAVAPHKVLMLVGATGAGKSTLINGMANYIMGVDWEDEFRFKLITEDTAHDQTVSQTKCITAYTFHRETKSFPLPNTLTVIDTPGFGDTAGLERDKEIVTQMKEFFSIQSIDQLHGIGFVTQAPLVRLTPTQRYVFDSILAVFGKDVADNIFLMVTFSDGMQPPVLDAIKAANVPFKNCYFKFNNSALFAGKTKTEDDFNKMFWRMGQTSFEQLFEQLSKAQCQSLQLSREVLQEREHLEVTIHGLLKHVCARLSKMDEIRKIIQILENFEADIIANREFTREVAVPKQRKVDLPPGKYTTNCLKCDFTCHLDCQISGGLYNCSAMAKRGSKDTTCTVCPKKCTWSVHVNNPYIFELYQEIETVTLDKLKAAYDTAMANQKQLEAVMKKLECELEEIDQAVLQNINQARQSLQRLHEIALRPDPLTEVEYIDILIESEKLEARPGWSERVKTLQEVRKQAEILSKVRKGHATAYSLPEHEGKSIWKFWSDWRKK